MYKIAYSIQKYNQETRNTAFINDIKEIELQKILFRKDNFIGDFKEENNKKIESGLQRFQEVYKKKSSSLSNQNFILTFSILNEFFFLEYDYREFQKQLYSALNRNFDILSFITTKDSIGDITFYVICTGVVKEIFLDHIIKNVLNSDKKPEDLQGVLSCNLLLGGTKSERPEAKFISHIIEQLSKFGYELSPASEKEKEDYIFQSYLRASSKIANLEKDIKYLLHYLITKDAKYIPFLNNFIAAHKLDALESIMKDILK